MVYITDEIDIDTSVHYTQTELIRVLSRLDSIPLKPVLLSLVDSLLNRVSSQAADPQWKRMVVLLRRGRRAID